MKYEILKQQSDQYVKRYTGVKRSTFETMLETIQSKYKLGRTPKFTLADRLLMSLTSWREYRTEFHLAQDYKVSESTVCRIIQPIENLVRRSGKYRLPSQKELCSSPKKGFEDLVVDVTEPEIERPLKKQKKHYSGKKKRHTQTAQIIITLDTKSIMATDFGHGKQLQLLADSGYQGLARIHQNCQIPQKKTKSNPLTKEQNNFNRLWSKKRIFVENVIRSLQIFKILSQRYRNRRKRFAFRFNLIAASYNSEIVH